MELRDSYAVDYESERYRDWVRGGRPRALPGNDFWLLDDERVMFNVFDGSGRPSARQHSDDPSVVDLCVSAFEAVWSRGIDHDDYLVRES
ncbi:DUF6879 family protein [Spirillospora sp. CA-294931]|uniref:DUF6879 family protein n=1 Tax=Spirillospora sp. CA-294931 TaxID=3240042 RepID=UPI003D8E8151